MSDDLVKQARLAQRDDRMSTGALYGDLADHIQALTAKLAEVEAERDHACDTADKDYARAEAAEARERDAYARGFKAALEKALGKAEFCMEKYAAAVYDKSTLKTFTRGTPTREQNAAKCYCAGEIAEAIRAIPLPDK